MFITLDNTCCVNNRLELIIALELTVERGSLVAEVLVNWIESAVHFSVQFAVDVINSNHAKSSLFFISHQLSTLQSTAATTRCNITVICSVGSPEKKIIVSYSYAYCLLFYEYNELFESSFA